MYCIGDLIFYGRTGTCRVEDIKEIDGTSYYSLRPLYQSCCISTPVDNPNVFSRPIISAREADEMIMKMPSIAAEPYYNRNLNQLREHYKAWIECHSCEELISMGKSLFLKKREAQAQNRKFGAVDERFLKETRELLEGEFAAALGLDRTQVRAYIEEKLGL